MTKPTIEINGQEVKLSQTRRSKKGARVDCARVHIDGLGTVYVQVYEPRGHVEARVRAAIAQPMPSAPLPVRVAALEEAMVAVLKRVSPFMKKDQIPAPRASA